MGSKMMLSGMNAFGKISVGNICIRSRGSCIWYKSAIFKNTEQHALGARCFFKHYRFYGPNATFSDTYRSYSSLTDGLNQRIIPFSTFKTHSIRHAKGLGPPSSGEKQSHDIEKGTVDRDTETQEESSEASLSVFQRFKNAYKEYGKVLVCVHVATSVVWYGAFFYAARSGIDVVPLLVKMGAGESIIKPFQSTGVGNFAVAYLLYKIATPARYTVTLAGTQLTVRQLRKMGYMETPSEEDSLRNLVKDGRTQMRDRVEKVKDRMEDVRDNVKDRFEDMKDNVKDRVEDVRDNVKDKVEDVKGNVKDKVEDVRGNVKDRFEDMRDNVKDKVEDVRDNVKDSVGDVRGNVKDRFEDMRDNVKDRVEGVRDNVNDRLEDVRDNGKDKVEDAKDNVKDKWKM